MEEILFAKVIREYLNVTDRESAFKWLKRYRVGRGKARDFMSYAQMSWEGIEPRYNGEFSGNLQKTFPTEEIVKDYVDWLRRPDVTFSSGKVPPIEYSLEEL
jgi:hypothetical protein